MTVWNERLIFWVFGWKILPMIVVFRSECRHKKTAPGGSRSGIKGVEKPCLK